MSDLTRPERYAEIGKARRTLAQVMRRGGCAMCLHRVSGWGLVACSRQGRTFPLCMKDRRTPGFELDETTVDQEAAG